AEKISKIENYDVIISGHMHVKDTFQFESNNEKKLSINLGSWLEEPSVLKFHFKENNLLVDNFEWINLK
ncbi:MAG: hypothetical protein KDD45_06410, partial [Bdellovibrionales bacterium]|nr:hypothetical protein [Bdellovibrionales bacterium]